MKQSYKIPFGLAQSYSDMTIALNSKDGTIARAVPLLSVAIYVLSFLACLFILMKTPIGRVSNIVQKFFFVVFWTAFTVLLAKYDNTNRTNAQRILTLISYIPRRSRHVYTRRNNSANAFCNCCFSKKRAKEKSHNSLKPE